MIKPQLSFKGQTVLITGATQGFGLEMAKTFVAAGAKVIGTGRNVIKAPRIKGVMWWSLDLSDAASIENVEKKIKAHGRIDVLINNAGINIIEEIYRIDLSHWEDVIKVNLTGTMRMMRIVSEIMISRRIKGRILNISSIYGHIARSQRNAYCASKAGVIGLTRASALDLAKHGILVNALCPGFVLTALTKRILSSADQKKILTTIPLGRFGLCQDVASWALWMCSSMNQYATGQAIIVDGGVSIS